MLTKSEQIARWSHYCEFQRFQVNRKINENAIMKLIVQLSGAEHCVLSSSHNRKLKRLYAKRAFNVPFSIITIFPFHSHSTRDHAIFHGFPHSQRSAHNSWNLCVHFTMLRNPAHISMDVCVCASTHTEINSCSCVHFNVISLRPPLLTLDRFLMQINIHYYYLFSFGWLAGWLVGGLGKIFICEQSNVVSSTNKLLFIQSK